MTDTLRDPCTGPKSCATCSAGPKYGPLPDPTPHAPWCPNRGAAYYGPSSACPPSHRHGPSTDPYDTERRAMRAPELAR